MLEELTSDDLAALELLKKARERRELDITEAAKRARRSEDNSERDSSYSGILAQEAISLHKKMMKLNRRVRTPRLLGRSGMSVQRGGVKHFPRSHFGNNRYPVSTPVLLSTPPELVGGSIVSDGYIFTTDHPQRQDSQNPTVSISRVLRDKYTGQVVKEAYEYIIHVAGQENGHPYAGLSGAAIDSQRDPNLKHSPVQDKDDPLYEEPIGLIRLANEELSRPEK
jgi:hypothetical protein